MEKMFQRAQSLATSKREKCSNRLLSPQNFLQLAADEVERATRYDRPLTVALILVDRLNAIRKADGIAVAETVLADVTARAIHMLRGPDRAGRLGPGQLGILMPETGLKQCSAAVERLCAVVRDAEIETDSGPRTVTLTVGLSALSARRRDAKAFLMSACFELRRAQSRGVDEISAAAPDLATVSIPRNGTVH
ncbi:MAG: diguanylate cyclase [Pseudomonadota bacterium]